MMNPKLYNLFISSQRKLYRFALSLTKDVNDAEDILQDTLLKLWKLREDWGSWENFEAYSMRMIRNEYLNHTKKLKGRVYSSLDDIPEGSEPSQTDTDMTTDHLMFRFNSLTSKLPDIQRNILHLREIEELEYKEIAKVMGITDAQVKVYLYRARQYLKDKVHGKR
ncbi:RNA polymerase sigma factor [Dyadobacter chenwenxiniae]|uniref:RNA polymerase sigma factor n=1 Tax=Dyadobacter chenwenxiniae TaxID=2906456 RepID=A0A9X1PLB0_9BACT|nr:RNA polymerase sigma factor [Dyadobacter chenwenxiniae]MCF0063210.1 RNA polymerase sigma factor [Dyadobacter chenwenxiniae]UON85410.1 RNA polymerase sigma factor [Dyadobacter chenwenxiniae]